MNKLYRLFLDFGRQGKIESLFIAKREQVEDAIGQYINFGEVLGKNSDIFCFLEWEDIEEIEVSEETITDLLNVFGDTVSGYNPLERIELVEEE